MGSMIDRLRGLIRHEQEDPAAAAPTPADERLKVLVGRQRVIRRGRGSVNESEGLVRDAS